MAQPHRVGFLLIDGFALMSFASAIEPLRAANVLAGKKLYQWLQISTGADAILASNGLSVASDHTIADSVRYDTVLAALSAASPVGRSFWPRPAYSMAFAARSIGSISMRSSKPFPRSSRRVRCSRSIATGSPAPVVSPRST
jgi:hypothetical protein